MAAAIRIGKAVRNARIDAGYTNRSEFVRTGKLKGKLTGEGLRKIEDGERIPRLENLRLLGEALGMSKKTVKDLERAAMTQAIERAVRSAGNADVEVKILGAPLRLLRLPVTRKVETFVREIVTELLSAVEKYGVMEEDINHFRRYARSSLLRHLERL